MFKILFSVAVVLVPAFVFAAPTQKMIDTKMSTVNWKGTKEFLNDSHTGTVSISSGFLTMDGEKITGGELVIDMNSIQDMDLKDDAMKQKLVSHLKSPDFFDVANHKDAKFVITKVISGKSASEMTFEGNMTIRGETKSVKIPATVKKDGSTWGATGKVELDRTQFGVKYNSKSFVPDLVKTAKDKVIKNTIVIEFSVKTVG